MLFFLVVTMAVWLGWVRLRNTITFDLCTCIKCQFHQKGKAIHGLKSFTDFCHNSKVVVHSGAAGSIPVLISQCSGSLGVRLLSPFVGKAGDKTGYSQVTSDKQICHSILIVPLVIFRIQYMEPDQCFYIAGVWVQKRIHTIYMYM